MILFYRITPVAVSLVSAASFLGLSYRFGSPMLIMPLAFVMIFFLFARLCEWHMRIFRFWHFVGTPLVHLCAGFGIILLFEEPFFTLAIGIVVTVLLTLFAEFVFQYVHLPVAYQAYSLEYLTLIIHLMSIFFLSALGFGVRLLIQTPLFALIVFLAPIILFLIYGLCWVSKIENIRSKTFAIVGMFLWIECFVALTFLPSGFYTDAVIITLGFYLFAGLTRAELLRKLSTPVLRRYLIMGICVLFGIILTTQWI